jgi:hypothetical protein
MSTVCTINTVGDGGFIYCSFNRPLTRIGNIVRYSPNKLSVNDVGAFNGMCAS